jgi:hypothetical protein
MKNFIIVAEQDRGKTYFVKELLKKFHNRKNFIFDINKEYGIFKNELRTVTDKDDFLNAVPCNDNSNINAVFEEASAFFSKSGTTSKDTIKHICRRFHTRNINIFVFHALDQIPTYILYYIDFIILFRTKDDPKIIEKRFSANQKIVKAFYKVRELTDGTSFNRFTKTYPNEKSKKFFHYNEVIQL